MTHLPMHLPGQKTVGPRLVDSALILLAVLAVIVLLKGLNRPTGTAHRDGPRLAPATP